MKLSLDDTWRDTVALLRANASMLLPLGGLFYLLPLILYSVATPVFVPPDTQDQQVMADALAQYLPRIALPLLALIATFVLGTSTIYQLLLGPNRPTVGGAIAAGVRSWPSLMLLTIILFAAQFVLLIAISVLAALLGLTGGSASLLFFAFLVAGLYVTARFSPAGPAMIAERLASPGKFLRRGLGLSKPAGWRIALFLFAITVAGLILVYAVQIVLGSVLVLALGDAGRQLAAVLGSILSAVATLILTVAYVAIYRRLATPAPATGGT